MFANLAAVASFAILAVATPTPGGSGGQCNTGSIQCCNQVTSSSSLTNMGGLLDILNLGGNVIPVGLECSPIAAIAGGNSCNSNAFCCEGNSVTGLVAIGCTQINL